MTCKDCIHEIVCGQDEVFKYGAYECTQLKNKADFVEVVRCSECQYCCAEYCTRDIKGRTNMFYMQPDDFCSYGERK